MKLYTVQLCSWREAKRLEIPLFDVSCRGRNEIFAPDRSDFFDYKAGKLTKETFIKRYQEKLLRTYNFYRPEWEEFLKRDAVALADYEPMGGHSTRHILKDFLLKLHLRMGKFSCYLGEITKEMKTPMDSTFFVPLRQSEFDFIAR